MRVKKGDKVRVIAGGCKGSEGVVLRVLAKDEKVLVQGVNMVKKHRKPSQAQPEGAIIEKEAAIHVSNVAGIDPKTKKPTKGGYRFEDGVKVRFSKSTGNKLD